MLTAAAAVIKSCECVLWCLGLSSDWFKGKICCELLRLFVLYELLFVVGIRLVCELLELYKPIKLGE